MKLRIIVAAAVFVSGAVHLKLWADGFRDISVIGPLFLLNAVAALVIAGAVLHWRSWPPLLVAVGFGASTLGAFVISATVGLFGGCTRYGTAEATPSRPTSPSSSRWSWVPGRCTRRAGQ